MDKLSYMDQSGLYAMEDVLVDLAKNGRKIVFVHTPEQPRYMMERIDIIPDLIPNEQMFDDFKECLVWIKENVEDIYPEDDAKKALV